MVRSILVSDTEEIQKLVNSLPSIANGIDDGKYVPVLSNGIQQLILVREGKPIMTYRVTVQEDVRDSADSRMGVVERFFDSFQGNKHLAMLYDDAKLARRVEFRYVMKGLEMGEQCLYVIPEDDVEDVESVRTQMAEYGIDVSSYLKNGALKLVRISDPARDPAGFKAGCQRILGSLLENIASPLRMVLHVRYRFNTKDEIQGHAEFENVIESNFTHFPGSMLCNHYIGKNTEEKHGEWTQKMLQTHDNVFVVSSQKGVPFFELPQ